MKAFAAVLLVLFGALSTDCTSDPPITTVAVVDFAFLPDTVVVPRRTSVVWNNTSADYHDIGPDTGAGQHGDGSIPEIPLAPVNGVDHTYRETSGAYYANYPGTYFFRCFIHPWMHGVLIVQ